MINMQELDLYYNNKIIIYELTLTANIYKWVFYIFIYF